MAKHTIHFDVMMQLLAYSGKKDTLVANNNPLDKLIKWAECVQAAEDAGKHSQGYDMHSKVARDLAASMDADFKDIGLVVPQIVRTDMFWELRDVVNAIGFARNRLRELVARELAKPSFIVNDRKPDFEPDMFSRPSGFPTAE